MLKPKLKDLPERRGVRCNENAGGPLNIHSGWNMVSYFWVPIVCIMLALGFGLFAVTVRNVLGIITMAMLSFIAFICGIMAYAGAFIRFNEMCTYQHNGYKAQCWMVRENGKDVPRFKEIIGKEDKLAIIQGFESSLAAMEQLQFTEMLPGQKVTQVEPKNFPSHPGTEALSENKKLRTELEIMREDQAKTKEMMKRLEAILSNAPTVNNPTKSKSATKTPPLPSRIRGVKCPECGKSCNGEFGLRAHVRTKHKAAEKGVD